MAFWQFKIICSRRCSLPLLEVTLSSCLMNSQWSASVSALHRSNLCHFYHYFQTIILQEKIHISLLYVRHKSWLPFLRKRASIQKLSGSWGCAEHWEPSIIQCFTSLEWLGQTFVNKICYNSWDTVLLFLLASTCNNNALFLISLNFFKLLCVFKC